MKQFPLEDKETSLPGLINTSAADDLAPKSARASAAMVLTWFSRKFMVLALEGLTLIELFKDAKDDTKDNPVFIFYQQQMSFNPYPGFRNSPWLHFELLT